MADAIEHGFKEGDKVWVEDGDGRRHPGIFVGNNEASGWFGGGPSAYVAHPEAHQAEVSRPSASPHATSSSTASQSV